MGSRFSNEKASCQDDFTLETIINLGIEYSVLDSRITATIRKFLMSIMISLEENCTNIFHYPVLKVQQR